MEKIQVAMPLILENMLFSEIPTIPNPAQADMGLDKVGASIGRNKVKPDCLHGYGEKPPWTDLHVLNRMSDTFQACCLSLLVCVLVNIMFNSSMLIPGGY